MSLTAKINIILNILHEKEIDLNTTRDAMNLTKGVAFTNGTGANQADTIFHDTRTLADGANETIVIDDGTLTDAFGDGVSIDEMKALYIKNNSADAGLIIGAAAGTQLAIFGTPATDTLLIKPGGEFLYICPDATGLAVAGAGDLKLEHDGVGTATLDYDIIVVGVA